MTTEKVQEHKETDLSKISIFQIAFSAVQQPHDSIKLREG